MIVLLGYQLDMNDLQPTLCKSTKGIGALIVGFELSGQCYPHELHLHGIAADNGRSELTCLANVEKVIEFRFSGVYW
jgi:hypothetical protein